MIKDEEMKKKNPNPINWVFTLITIKIISHLIYEINSGKTHIPLRVYIAGEFLVTSFNTLYTEHTVIS